MRKAVFLVTILALGGPAAAQSGATYRLEEHVLNAAGHPEGGGSMSGASFRVTLDAVGDAVAPRTIQGSSHVLDSGFGSAYPPPREVTGLSFATKTDLAWTPEPSVGVYNLYRGLRSTLAGLGYGSCAQQGLTVPGASDTDPVPSGDGYFYLVTAENRLAEEGTKGFQASGGGATGPERMGSACP